MVANLLGVDRIPGHDDIADACAVAVCHHHRGRLGAVGRAPPGSASTASSAARPSPVSRAARHWLRERSMIALTRGELVAGSDDDHVVLETGRRRLRGPLPPAHHRDAAQMGDRAVTLYVHTAVSDDAIRLYGFLGRDELRLFRLLIGVERIGPKAALCILGRAELPTLVRAIRDGDVALVATVPGIGRRTAERVILELRDRVTTSRSSLEPAAPHRRRPGESRRCRGSPGWSASASGSPRRAPRCERPSPRPGTRTATSPPWSARALRLLDVREVPAR